MSTATTLRFDEADKLQATELLKSMGITFNGYLSMAVRQLLNQRRIPFDIVPTPCVPTEETLRAMVAAEAKEQGLIPDDGVRFNAVEDAMAWLEEE